MGRGWDSAKVLKGRERVLIKVRYMRHSVDTMLCVSGHGEYRVTKVIDCMTVSY